jgi:hypothetical protein
MSNTRLNIEIDKDLRKRFKKVCLEQDVSLKDKIIDLIENFLSNIKE